MGSKYGGHPSPTPAAAQSCLWSALSPPGVVFQPVWLCLTLPVKLTDPQPFAANACTTPSVSNNFEAIEKPSPKENRKFFLDRLVFDLVAAHEYLALTDPTLLGWYLHLSPEDRKIIQDEGGFQQFLQRHPALELSLHHVYVKSFNRPIIPDPNHPKAQKARGSPLSQLNAERPSWQVTCSAAAFKHPAAPASFSVNRELGRHRQEGTPGLRGQTSMTQGQRANCTCAHGCPLQSTFEKASPEYYSFDSIQMDGREYRDRSFIQAVEQQQVSSLLYPAEESRTKEGCRDHVGTGGYGDAGSSFKDQRDHFHSIREEDDSILVCVASKDVEARNKVHSDPVCTVDEALAASRESDHSVVKMSTAEKDTSPMPGVTTCEVMVGTELAPGVSAFTQTEDPGSSDKNVLTEVHMSDLDYVAKEFIKLKMAKENVRAQKAKMIRVGCKLRKECDCIQRTLQTELCLLALQYSMCRQHCWTVYCISAEGGQLTQMPKNPPANIVSVLQKLESDYNQMRDKILAGVPLQQLEPLRVDSEKITTGASYIPAQIISDVLGHVPSWSSLEPQKRGTSGEENGCPENESRSGEQRREKEIEEENSKARAAVTCVPQDRDAVHNSDTQGPKQIQLDSSEKWYDAEEDLEPAGPAVAAETGQDPAAILKDTTDEAASEEAKSSVLCVSNLPSNATESDVMLWFEKYHASEVSISALKNDLRIAVVMISGHRSADAAVRELNGCSIQGHTLHVEHINRDLGGSQSRTSASISGPESSQDAAKPQTSKPDLSSAGRKPTTEQPLGSGTKRRTEVCTYLMAKGASEPQHSGTTMAEVKQQHSDVGRQRIVDALVELKARHHGVLSSLPPGTIGEMASELLTRPESATQS